MRRHLGATQTELSDILDEKPVTWRHHNARARRLRGDDTAQNATWLASSCSGDFDTGGNWSTGTVPTGIASFGMSNKTSLTLP
jgi:hypothetical protein